MSHVDDGILHAYLDGELGPMERERLEGHFAACPPCRMRLTEERSLIERAQRLLDLAVPAAPTRAAPPLHGLRRRPAWWHVRIPLVWAATLTLAVGAGWFLRGRTIVSPKATTANRPTVVTAPHPASVEVATAPAAEAPPVAARQAPTPAAEVAIVSDGTVEPSDAAVAAKAADRLRPSPPDAALRGEAGRVSGQVVTVAPAAPLALDEPAPGRNDLARLSTTWTVIGSRSARDLLGTDPATIPGRPIRALRRGPGPTPEIVVEQELGGGVVVLLFEQVLDQGNKRARREMVGQDGAVARANERLARFVGSLRVEIAGPLPTDSLSRLLELVR
jgi:anti-sigma factor RsiW